MQKRSFLKAMVAAGALLAAVSSGACNNDRGELSIEKARAAAAHSDTLQTYRKELVAINNGVMTDDSTWDATRRKFTEIRDRAAILDSIGYSVDEDELVEMAHADSAVYNWFHDVQELATQLNDGSIRTFEEYSQRIFEVSGRYNRIEVSFRVLHSGGFEYPVVRNGLRSAMNVIEERAVALLKEGQSAGRDVQPFRNQAKTGYGRLMYLWDLLVRKWT